MSKKQSLLGNIGVQVVIAMIIGTAVGAFMGESAEMFAPLGAIFINLSLEPGFIQHFYLFHFKVCFQVILPHSIMYIVIVRVKCEIKIM